MMIRSLPLMILLMASPLVAMGLAADEHGHDEHGHAEEGHVEKGHDEHGHEEAETPKGPHGGRLLAGDGFAVEVEIFETGVEPQFRVRLYEDGEVLDPAKASLELAIRRLGREPEEFRFSPRGDFLLGDRTVTEPHSFKVDVEASWGSHSLKAGYESVEGRVELASDVATAGGVSVSVAGPRSLERSRRLTGRVGIASDRMAELKPRFAGIVRSATGNIGDSVAAGANLAILENSQTLSQFRVDAPFGGVILSRRAVAGSSVGVDDVLYVVADLSQVWADFDVYGEDTAVVRAGESVRIRDDTSGTDVAATISYVSPLRDVHTQTTLARAVLANADGRWAPGTFLSATISLDEKPADVAVPISSLQTWRGADAVFVFVEGVFEVRPVVVGRRGERWLEILEGIEPGDQVAGGNSFLLRAEIEKAGAHHDH